jgi:cytochrome oxidase Cu insertion factor (SCO1/SenC/PrrC family)
MNPIRSLAAILLLAAAPQVLPPAVGQPAPDFKLADQTGRQTALSSARGRKAVLVFYRGYW